MIKRENTGGNEPFVLFREFYQRSDVVSIARELLGKYLVTRIGSAFFRTILNETKKPGISGFFMR
ncbi:MAG: hypothetical protein M0P47_08750 [Bacteroidales bacterium]|nr:hypothetical protein [Bacteroidales bacterium]